MGKNNLPENSIASLKQAVKLKCAGSEFDVRMTADKVLIIHHDPDYNKLSIEKTNYVDLVSFRLSNGEKLPTFREYILAGMKNKENLSFYNQKLDWVAEPGEFDVMIGASSEDIGLRDTFE